MNLRLNRLGLLAAAAALSAAPAAFALENFVSYDNFASAPISPDRWVSYERTRVVKNGALSVVQRDWGPATGNVGTLNVSYNSALSNPAPVTQFKATVKVNALSVTGCAGNPTATRARARIYGSYFNSGTPVAGNSQGDVLAQIRVWRDSASTDPAGVLKVDAYLIVCQSSDCALSATVSPVVSLGSVNVGTATTLQIEWDKPNKRFLYSRDGGAFSGETAYTLSDSAGPATGSRQLGTRTEVAYCTGAPQPSAFVDASFDNVAVNKSAAP